MLPPNRGTFPLDDKMPDSTRIESGDDPLTKAAKDIAAKWKPTEKDLLWIRNLLDNLNVDGVWISDAMGVIFKKTGESKLELEHFELPGLTNPEDAFGRIVDIEKTKQLHWLA
jgi:hypothetical protein